jgi:adenine-specific DNA-methyltransferase
MAIEARDLIPDASAVLPCGVVGGAGCLQKKAQFSAPVIGGAAQLPLWEQEDAPIAENPEFLSKQLLTYIGNKRSLLGEIGTAVTKVKKRLNKERLRILDAFAGSGVVSRSFKGHASYLASNDMECYAAVVGRCYLANASDLDWPRVIEAIRHLNDAARSHAFQPGFIEELYAPRDEANITVSDRVFYTRRNAQLLDNYRRLLPMVPGDLRDLCLGPLLSEASVHANTAGVFKGFYKDRNTGIGQFGGTNADALTRIRGEIRLEAPVLSRFECEFDVLQEDANRAVRMVRDLDLAYFDPPYNQHPYGSNYFMLNLLVNSERPAEISQVSGIPVDWKRSAYNVRAKALSSLRDLLHATDARFLLVSFNNEGFVSRNDMDEMLRNLGSVEVMETRYNTFRGSRNLRNRNIHVTEQLFLVERSA